MENKQPQAIDPQDVADVAAFFHMDVNEYADMHGYDITVQPTSQEKPEPSH